MLGARRIFCLGVALCTFTAQLGCSGEERAQIETPHVAPRDRRDRGSPPEAPRIANYKISARLEESTHEVIGQERITFTNTSNAKLKELYFHLYLNAFENEETLFLRAGGGRSGAKHGRFGSIDVASLTSPSYPGTDLWKEAALHSPGDPKDRTDIRVPLSEPLLPGETLVLDCAFTAHLPEVVERTGYAGDFHLVAQWFPKLAKLEADGTWAHFAFHSYAEFYADFGDYDVTLDVAEQYIVGATGSIREQNSAKAGRRIYRATASPVHDFAWTAWPAFSAEERTLHDISVRVLTPEHAPNTRSKIWETLELGLPFLAERYGSYPYPTLTVVLPPAAARSAMGMEYPTFIVVAGDELASYTGSRHTELVTIHELAHQWFQGIVASNEAGAPFLDEGITSYAEWQYLDARFGPSSLISLPGLSVSREAVARYVDQQHPLEQPINTPASEFKNFSRISHLVYTRTPLALLTLGNAFGEEATALALQSYALQNRFRHPSPSDFYASLGNSLNKKAENAAREIFNQRGSLDLSVEEVVTQKRGSKDFLTTFSVRNTGKLILPHRLLLTLSDGRTIVLRGTGKTQRHRVVHDAPLSSISVDPEHRLKLDENYLNNRYFTEPPSPENKPRALLSLTQLMAWCFTWGTH